MRGNSQNGGQTTKSLLIKPQCSGVPIQQAVSLSSSFPRHCLLFVCAFFREMQESAGAEGHPLPPPPAYKTAPASITETGAVRLLYGYFFQALAQNLARGLLVSPAYAGKRLLELLQRTVVRDPPPRMQGKDKAEHLVQHHVGITPAYAGKKLTRLVMTGIHRDHPRVCGEKSRICIMMRIACGSPPRMRGKACCHFGIDHHQRIIPAYARKSHSCFR